MGRGISKATKEKLLEENIKKVKYMLFNNQEEKEFRIYSGKKEGDTEESANSKPDEFSQEDIIRSILKEQDTLAVLPTGGGKSYCFQGPSFCFKGITLVITPLVALIQDQVKNFNTTYKKLYDRYENNEEGIVGSEYYHGELYRAIYPGMNNLSLNGLFDEIAHPHEWDEWDTKHKVQYRLLYISPERLSTPKFVRELKKREENGEIQIDCVVVDEAHCMSQWGFDFRERYLSIGNFIEKLKKRPVIAAFSATVTRQDIQQISTLLRFPKNAPCYVSYMERSNLHLVAITSNMENDEEDWQIDQLKNILSDSKGKLCIVYCTSVKNVNYLHDLLRNQFDPAKYHGGRKMSDTEKKENLDRFLFQKECNAKDGSTNIMIATKAFGMGINRDNIEVIVHYDIPRCIEDYYQEIGRAGRDKNIEAKCYLLNCSYSMNEMIRQVLAETKSEDWKKQAIASQFSEKMRKHIRFYSFYRMVRMWKYSEGILGQHERPVDPENPQNYIANYFDEEKIDESNVQLLKQFYEYLERNIYPKEEDGEKLRLLIQESFTFDEEYIELLNSSDYQEEIKKELIQIVGQVNELHINNTRIANYLRWHGEQYEIADEQNRPNTIVIPIKGERKRNVSFTFSVTPEVDVNEKSYNEYKLNYFDLCVADAIYSIEVNGNRNNYIYPKTIWNVLSGKKTAFSRSDSKIKSEIEKSIDKMQHLRITIEDEEFPEGIHYEVFMPIKRREGEGERGYYYEKTPPLYRYAEAINGEFITIPVSLMDGSKISMSGSVENIVLFHYLLHRIAINRGNYVQFDTIHKMLVPHLPHSRRDDMESLKKNVVFILAFYNRIQYQYVSFGGYVKDFCIKYERDGDTRSSKGTIIFQFADIDKESRLFEINSRWGRCRNKDFSGYAISKDTEKVIRKNENSYDDYDGIVFFRNDKMIKSMYDKMDRRLIRDLNIKELNEWMNNGEIEHKKHTKF